MKSNKTIKERCCETKYSVENPVGHTVIVIGKVGSKNNESYGHSNIELNGTATFYFMYNICCLRFN